MLICLPKRIRKKRNGQPRMNYKGCVILQGHRSQRVNFTFFFLIVISIKTNYVCRYMYQGNNTYQYNVIWSSQLKLVLCFQYQVLGLPRLRLPVRITWEKLQHQPENPQPPQENLQTNSPQRNPQNTRAKRERCCLFLILLHLSP